MCWSSKCHRNWSLARRKLKFYLISAVRSIEPLTKMFFDGVHLILDLFFVFEGSQHILTIADMIIARLLSPEICDTVSNFTSLTIKGFCVASSRCCNFCLVVHSLQPVSSLSFFFGNFLRKMEQRFLWMNCIHTCCRGETVIKLKEKNSLCKERNNRKKCKILRIFHWFPNVTVEKKAECRRGKQNTRNEFNLNERLLRNLIGTFW